MDSFDVIVVGGGPVGLHAALKAAVLRQTVLVVDRGPETTRVWQAPAIANIPGMPGISGPDLVRRLHKDLDSFTKLSGQDLVRVATPREAVEARRTDEGTFRVRLRRTASPDESTEEGEWVEGRTLVLATGVVDRKPGVPETWRGGQLSPYVHRGEIGYCLLCEGWSLHGHDVVVLGRGEQACQIASDLSRHFGARVTLCELDAPARHDEDVDLQQAHEAEVRVEAREVRRIRDAGDKRITVEYGDGTHETFDKAILAYGFHRVNNDLAIQLGARLDEEGYVVTNPDCEVLDKDGDPIRGLFAIGDVRDNRWKQVVIGWGEAERAIITAYAFRLPDE